MGKKTKQTQATHQRSTVPDTPDIVYARDQVRQGADFSTPIYHGFAQAGQGIENQIFEHDLNPAVRDQIKRSQLFNLQQGRGAALSSAKAQEAAFKTGNAMNLGSMTATRDVSGTGSGTVTQGGLGMWTDPLVSIL